MTGEDSMKLGTLLNYWIEHNEEHGQEFKEWAEKIRPDDSGVAEELLQAASEMDKATGYLVRARERLEKEEV
jgi:hypothetical protein